MRWGFGHWCLLVLAAAVVAAYLGVLGPAQDVVDRKAIALKQRAELGLAALKSTIRPRVTRVESKIEGLGEQQRVKDLFDEPDLAQGEALVTLVLFLLLTPVAAIMAFIVLMFLLTAIANVVGPWIGSRRVAMFIVTAGCALAFHLERAVWLPHLAYIAGIVVHAYSLLRLPGSV